MAEDRPFGEDDDFEDDGDERDDHGEDGDETEDREGPRDLDPREKEDVQADLDDLSGMRRAFEAQGVKGVVIACPDCGSNHFYDWDLLRESLEHMLDTGEPRMHEPAFEPREDEYIQWDYGKGYIDALSDAGLDGTDAVQATSCPWCAFPIEPQYGFCPRCGRSLGALRIYRELVDRGFDERDARAILVRAGFEPF
ncbi:MAG: DUF5319 family protein [Actinobacteria bacterium]|nr:DUF5319 family protein [Actinomycetota bacterium]